MLWTIYFRKQKFVRLRINLVVEFFKNQQVEISIRHCINQHPGIAVGQKIEGDDRETCKKSNVQILVQNLKLFWENQIRFGFIDFSFLAWPLHEHWTILLVSTEIYPTTTHGFIY